MIRFLVCVGAILLLVILAMAFDTSPHNVSGALPDNEIIAVAHTYQVSEIVFDISQARPGYATVEEKRYWRDPGEKNYYNSQVLLIKGMNAKEISESPGMGIRLRC